MTPCTTWRRNTLLCNYTIYKWTKATWPILLSNAYPMQLRKRLEVSSGTGIYLASSLIIPQLSLWSFLDPCQQNRWYKSGKPRAGLLRPDQTRPAQPRKDIWMWHALLLPISPSPGSNPFLVLPSAAQKHLHLHLQKRPHLQNAPPLPSPSSHSAQHNLTYAGWFLDGRWDQQTGSGCWAGTPAYE